MRDYLYIPLGGSRVASKSRLFFNLWLVFLISGLWHGASWNFVVWGAYHGLFLILDRLFLVRILNKAGNFVSIVFTFFIVMIGWVIFRLESMSDILIYIQKLFEFSTFKFPETIPSYLFFLAVAVFFSFVYAFKVGKTWEAYVFKKENYSLSANLGFGVLSAVLFLVSLSSITSSGFNPFIYFRF